MPKPPIKALHDPVLCSAPNLFKSLAKGRRNEPLDIDYTHGDERFKIRSEEQLGCDDLRVLQGVVGLAHAATLRIVLGKSRESALELRRQLGLSGDAQFEDVLLVVTSIAELANAAGYGVGGGGTMSRQIHASLRRLSATRVERAAHGRSEGWQLLAADQQGTGHYRLRIALNPRLGLCALAGCRFVQIDMNDARQLKGDLARLLHQRLSGWIDTPSQGSTCRRVTVAKLMTYAWGNPPASLAAGRKRRASLRAALSELRSIGWRIRAVPGRAELLEITRQSRSDRQSSTAVGDDSDIIHGNSAF